ncbi:COG4223 family protein [Mesorhizobium sp. UC22_110]|uniref:COG4223 family protein n=1 Tax=unclassified Mesorhizobium TaxID=325217 RepID=UPI00366CB52F
MVKTPKTRHSRSRREPVTIDLDPADVSRVGDKDRPDTGKQPEEALAAQADISETESPKEVPASASGASPAATEDKVSESRGFDYDFGESDARTQSKATEQGTAPEAAKVTDGDKTNGGFVNNQPVEPKRGGPGVLAAGVIGGVVALAGMGALQAAGLFGSSAANSEIAALKSEVAALKSSSKPDASVELSAALDQVKTDVATLKAAPAASADEGQVKTLSDKIAELDAALTALRNESGAVDLGPLNSKVTTLDAQMQSAQQAAAALDGRLGMVEQQASQLAGKVDAQASQPKIALAIAASALKASLERGAPFTAELDTFAAVRPDAPQIATLRAYAEKGVPSRIDIAAGMADAANAMVSAATPVDPDESIFQRLLTSAESLVKVRPIGAVEGKGAPETVARMEVAVNQGDYAKALSEFDTLPDTAKAAGADFAGKLKARQDAEAAVNELVSGAMKG